VRRCRARGPASFAPSPGSLLCPDVARPLIGPRGRPPPGRAGAAIRVQLSRRP
jgi:hypothetical protein